MAKESCRTGYNLLQPCFIQNIIKHVMLTTFLKQSYSFEEKKICRERRFGGQAALRQKNYAQNREWQFVRPHARAQSNRVQFSNNSNWALDVSSSSKIWLFHSNHNSHIKHNGMKFQISDEWFPNEFLDPNKRSKLLVIHKPQKYVQSSLHGNHIIHKGIAFQISSL